MPLFTRRAASITTGVTLSLVITVAIFSRRRADSGSTPSPSAVTASANARSNIPSAAVQNYVQGRYWWNKRGAGLLKSIGFFGQALDADPTFAPAYSGMGDAYVQLGYASALAPSDAFPKARAAAQRALDLDPILAEPHATLAYVAMYYDLELEDGRAGIQACHRARSELCDRARVVRPFSRGDGSLR